jgi:DNA repair exonuclease SbcCD ATPase subunit
MPEETSQNQPAGQPRDQSRESGGEDILAIIRNVESQLDQLKQAKNDQERMLQTLLHQQSDLEQQDHQLIDRASRLEERERAVEDAEAKAAERAASLDRRAGELSGAEQEIAEQSRSLAEREESLAVREREAIEQQQAFEHQFAEILEQAQAFKSDRAEFTRARAELEAETSRLRERLERLEADLQTALDERGVLESDNARLRGELEAASASAEGAEATDEAIRSLKESLEKRDERISGLLERLEDARAEAARFRESLPDASSRDQRLAEAHEELESLRKQVAESIRSREELERLRAEHASLRERLEGEPDREATSGELAKLRESLSGAAEQAEAISAAGAGLARLQELISAQDLSPEASEKLAGEVEAQRARADAAREDAEELRQRLEEAMARMEELERTRQAPDDEAAREQIARRDRAIAQLTEQLKESETARAELSQKKASSGGEHEWERRRRERLRAIRNSLRDKASRLSQAKEIIEQRQSECEQILKLRSELAASREALKREKDDLAKTSAKSGAGVAAILAAVAMLALAPLAWKAATIFAPATHLSTAVIELRARDGGPLPAESRQRFQMLIADLAQDPQLVDQAAKRMQRRGIESYADAATLAAALRDQLDVSFPEIGAAEIAYTDKGDLLAKRTLETYIAAIVSAANDRSAARLENTTIAVRQAPSDPSPVDRGAQPLYAAGIWAGSSVVVLGFLILVAIGMSKARERIRSEEAMLNAARDGSGIGWGDLPGS